MTRLVATPVGEHRIAYRGSTFEFRGRGQLLRAALDLVTAIMGNARHNDWCREQRAAA
jgi:hypothetical protein